MKDVIYFRRPKHLFNVTEFLEELAAADIRKLVLAPHMGGQSLLETSVISELKHLLECFDIQTPAIHGLFRHSNDLNSDDPKHLIESHSRLLKNVSALGVKTYVVHCGLPISGRSRDEEWQIISNAVESLLPIAEENGIIIALENLPPEYLGSDPNDLVKLVEAFNSKFLRLCFDSGHANMCGDPEGCLRKMSPYVVTMHLHDNDGTSDSHLSPGEGTIDWKVMVREIRACPNVIHLEIETFNREGRSHREIWDLYRRLLRS